jgi:hypothetical protein
MEAKGPLPCSREPSAGPYPEPDKFESISFNPISVRPILFSFLPIRLDFHTGLFPAGFLTKILYAYSLTWSFYYNWRRVHKLLSSSLCCFFNPYHFIPLKPKLMEIIFKYLIYTGLEHTAFLLQRPINNIMLFKVIIAVCYENHKKHMNTFCEGKNAGSSNVKTGTT